MFVGIEIKRKKKKSLVSALRYSKYDLPGFNVRHEQISSVYMMDELCLDFIKYNKYFQLTLPLLHIKSKLFILKLIFFLLSRYDSKKSSVFTFLYNIKKKKKKNCSRLLHF